jgi:septum formation protein
MQLSQLILGSQSPRRKEILSYFSLPFTQISPTFDEESVLFQGDPQEYVCAISRGKAQSLAALYPQATILTADTTVFCEGKIYAKPQDEAHACQMLSELVGKWHTVYTGVTVQSGEKAFHEAEATRVLFNPLTLEQIRHYISRTQWADKAGGYAIQMRGGLIVRKIDGCYYNVMGLPINTMERLLKHFGIELWDYL